MVQPFDDATGRKRTLSGSRVADTGSFDDDAAHEKR